MIYAVAVVIWVVFTIFAFNNHFLRQEMYGPRIGDLAAHYVGVVLQVLFILGVTYLFLNWLRGNYTVGQLWIVGVLWLVLMAVGETVFYRSAGRRRWEDWLRQYDLRRGRVWWLVPLALLLGPPLMHALFFAA